MTTPASDSSKSSCNTTAYSEWRSGQLEDDTGLPLSLNSLIIDLLQVDRSEKQIWKTMNFDKDHDDFISLYGGRRPKRLNISNWRAMEGKSSSDVAKLLFTALVSFNEPSLTSSSHLDLIMEVSAVWCQDGIKTLQGTGTGGHGPPSEYLKDDYHGDFLLSVHDTMCNNYCLGSDYLRAEAIATSQCTCLELSTKERDISYTKEGNFCLKNSGHLLCQRIVEYNQTICTDCELDDFMCARREYNTIEVPLKGRGDECNGGMVVFSSSMFGVVVHFALAIMFLR